MCPTHRLLRSLSFALACALLMAACRRAGPPRPTALPAQALTELPTATPAATAPPSAYRAPPTGYPAPALAASATAPSTVLPGQVGPFFEDAPIQGVVSGTVTGLTSSPGGQLWLTTDLAVARYVTGTWQVTLPALEGQLVGLDPAGRVWSAAPDGSAVQAWDGQAWHRFGAEAGWTLAQVQSSRAVQAGLVSDNSGRLWLATSQDVRAFDGERWTVYDRQAMQMPAPANGSAQSSFTLATSEPDGTLWVSECDWRPGGPAGAGVRWFDGQAWRGADSPVASGCGGALAPDASGGLWAGVDGAVWSYAPDGSTWTRYDPPAPPGGGRFGRVADIVLDPTGAPWPSFELCSDDPCTPSYVRYRLADGQWLQVGAASPELHPLLFDSTGTAWVFQPDGVYRVEANGLSFVADLKVLSATTDAAGLIWAAGQHDGQVSLWLLRPGAE